MDIRAESRCFKIEHKRCECVCAWIFLSEICKKKKNLSGCFVFEVSTFRNTNTHPRDKKNRVQLQFICWCVFHACVCFFEALFSDFFNSNCVYHSFSLSFSVRVCCCVCVWVCFDTQKRQIYRPKFFSLSSSSFCLVLLLLSLLDCCYYSILFNQIFFSSRFSLMFLKSNLLWIWNRKNTQKFPKTIHIHTGYCLTAPQELNTQETLNWWWFDNRRGTTESNWQESKSREKKKKSTKNTTTDDDCDQPNDSVRPYEQLTTRNAFALSLPLSRNPTLFSVFVSSICVKYRENLSLILAS